jgi:uncharacterized protein (TIGR00288 family)
MAEEAHSLAVFIDFENLALGAAGDNGGAARAARSRTRKKKAETLDIKRILERLVEKGKVIVKVAYADWARFQDYVHSLHESGIELIEIPERGMTGKNSADIRLCVDAMDLCWAKEHVDTFVIVSGDSDFTPLVQKLKENGKTVIGLGMKDSTSDLLASNCDEFIYYEDLGGGTQAPAVTEERVPAAKRTAMRLLLDSVRALMRENQEVMYASMVKDTMKRKRPSFSESQHGYRSFSDMLQDAEKLGLVTLRKDARSGTYVVEGLTK